MANLKSKQLSSLLIVPTASIDVVSGSLIQASRTSFTTASIDVVSGSLIPIAANLYNIGSSTLPYKSGSFQNLDVSSTGQVSITNLFVSDISRFTGSIVLKEQTTSPTAQEGGLMYSGSNFYLGFD